MKSGDKFSHLENNSLSKFWVFDTKYLLAIVNTIYVIKQF